MRRIAAVVPAVMSIALAACGGDGSNNGGSPVTPTSPPQAAAPTKKAAPAKKAGAPQKAARPARPRPASRPPVATAAGEIVLQTACLRPLSADRKLVLGKVAGLEGAYVATGGGRLGLMMGPAMAWLMAELIANDATGVPLDEFDPGRFAV